ncbi:hypothetical protein [Enterobacter sp.]|uniref:hypothetical protein n=1 Tax=Enterobacter sp. TaxID=42895 RepID=UPI00296FE9F3|nr:hypothetical protein [Enterobacter sp.]
MATTLNQTHPLLTVPFTADTDFTVLADHCEHFAETLIESDDPALRLAMCGRLNACLMLLQPTLNDIIPPHLVPQLTVDTPPAEFPHFEPESDLLCEYCLALTRLVNSQSLPPDMEKTLTGLLCELVWYFTDIMKAPRWVKGTDA